MSKLFFCFTVHYLTELPWRKRVGRHAFIHVYSVADIESRSANLVQSFSNIFLAMVATRWKEEVSQRSDFLRKLSQANNFGSNGTQAVHLNHVNDQTFRSTPDMLVEL